MHIKWLANSEDIVSQVTERLRVEKENVFKKLEVETLNIIAMCKDLKAALTETFEKLESELKKEVRKEKLRRINGESFSEVYKKIEEDKLYYESLIKEIYG